MTLRLSSLYESAIKSILKEYKSAMKYNHLMMTTSRYGRRIKLRSVTDNYAIANDSDDARHGFEESFAISASNTYNKHATKTTNGYHHDPQPSTSSGHNNMIHATSSSNIRQTRSSARLKTSQSVTLQSRSSHQQSGVRRSETVAFEKSYFTKGTSESDHNNTNSDLDNEVSINEANNNSKKNAKSSSVLNESYVNGIMSSQNTSNDASMFMQTNDKTVNGIKREDETSRGNQKYSSNHYDSDHEHENKPISKKQSASTSSNISRTRSSKRTRAQNKSYKEITSSSNNEDLSDSSPVLSKKTVRRKKQRRISSSFDENLNGTNSFVEPNSNSNSSFHDFEVEQKSRISTRGRTLKPALKN
jgi:hypothetical protein